MTHKKRDSSGAMDADASFPDRMSAIYKRMHRADKRNTGMRLNHEEVGDLAWALSNQIASVVYPEKEAS